MCVNLLAHVSISQTPFIHLFSDVLGELGQQLAQFSISQRLARCFENRVVEIGHPSVLDEVLSLSIKENRRSSCDLIYMTCSR